MFPLHGLSDSNFTKTSVKIMKVASQDLISSLKHSCISIRLKVKGGRRQFSCALHKPRSVRNQTLINFQLPRLLKRFITQIWVKRF